ncbi:threonine synthase, partial [Halomonas sp. SIMBA_159]
VDGETLERWRALTYPQLATEVLGLFATDIPRADLARMTDAAYAGFPDGVVPLRAIDDELTLVGLSEGPTLAFKDMAMQFLGQVLEYTLERNDAVLNILGATSGDTGSAAEHALRGKERVAVFMLSPQGRMSAFQRA